MTTDTANNPPEQTTLDGAGNRAVAVLAPLGGVALLIAFLVGLFGEQGLSRFFHAYLVGYCFVLSFSLGALLFVAVQHATRSGWSVTVRRLAEIIAGAMPVLVILFLPIVVPVLLGDDSLYGWADAEMVQSDPHLQHKAGYLSPAFFGMRCVVYFLVWGLLARFFLARSCEQDQSGDPRLTLRMQRVSAPALLALFLTITFAAFDWLMSLEPEWFSTIYGLYFFSGAVVGFLGLLIIAAVWLQRSGRLTESITVEHYHDLGKLLFAFVVFWGYIAFSQYMLIWYANIPEETVWYRDRLSGAWGGVAVVLLAGHLLIPFFGLLSRHVKRNRPLLAFWAVWLLVMHWLDLYWLVMPVLDPEGPVFSMTDLLCLVGLLALYTAGVLRTAGERSLVASRDPRVEESLAFENI